MKPLKLLMFPLLLLATTACEKTPPSANAPEQNQAKLLNLFVSIPPQAFFAERIGGDRVKVDVLVGPGQSPHTYSPTPAQVAALQKCDAYFAIGLPFEARLLAKVTSSRPDLNVVDGTTGVEILMMDADHDHDHDHVHEHGHEEEHGDALSAAAPDPHVWLDPKRVKTIARNICVELSMLDPDHGGEYRANLDAFLKDLTELDQRIAKILAPLAGREFFVFHPAYGYFGDSYGLKQRAVEIEGKEPTPQQLARLIEQARAADVKVIFVQPQFADGSARAVAQEIGGAVVPLDPLARDYLKNMNDMAAKLADALGEKLP